jgi:hypothetical protein
MIQKAKSKHELNKIISFNNIDKKFNLDELKEKIIKTEKVDKSFKDKEFKQQITNKQKLLEDDYKMALNNRKNNPYKCIIKKFDYTKKIEDEQDLIVFKPKNEDKEGFINDYKSKTQIKKIQDDEIKNIYTEDKKDEHIKKFEYKQKYKYNLSIDNPESPTNDIRKDRINFYKKEQSKESNNSINDIFDDLIKKGALSENLEEIDYNKLDVDDLEQRLIKEFGKEKYEEMMKNL